MTIDPANGQRDDEAQGSGLAVTGDPPSRGHRRGRRRWRRLGCLTLLLVVLVAAIALESRTSAVQSRVFTRIDRSLGFRMEPGASDSVWFPSEGPYDQRRGYTLLPEVTRTLLNGSYRVEAQARLSPAMTRLTHLGIYPIYREGTQAGLFLEDRDGGTLYRATYPQRVYADFDSIPALVVSTLLYIENRELLDPKHATRNPAVEWDRLAKAVVDLGIGEVRKDQGHPGGSTLATQLEKYRHSPEGRTGSPKEKLRQMIAASLRAYLGGRNTIPARERIVKDYVNSVPLAAAVGFGEVNGLGDGLWAWYDTEFADVNRILGSGADSDPAKAEAYKKVLSLFIAHRRPSVYLARNRKSLRTDTDSYLRLLARAGVISPALRDAALPLPLVFRRTPAESVRPSYIDQKAANAVRTRLLNLLGLHQLYVLDRIDLSAGTTLDGPVERRITHTLERLEDPAFTDSLGLRGYRLLERGDPSGVIYSFTLYESTPRGNLLRVQADNYNQPLDINEGGRLDLGSTAKLRTLVTYLQIVAGLHDRYAGQARPDLAKARAEASDPISRWALDWLSAAPDTTLPPMLQAALGRSYSANPSEKFFTGGGLHTFKNFNADDNGRVLTVQEGLRNSVNLVFIRLMRDVARYYATKVPGYDSKLLVEIDHPGRKELLARFADREGKDFLRQFWRKYHGKGPGEATGILARGVRPTPRKLAALYRTVHPTAPADSLGAFLRKWIPSRLIGDRDVARLYEDYAPGKYNLQDLGVIVGVHPLELWLVGHLQDHPAPTWAETSDAAAGARQESYRWLFSTRSLEKQNTRIRILLEIDAFQLIQREWRKLGYPFENLTPSYATAIGSSGDRPAALAELVGILVNGGVRMPQQRLEHLHFAAGTPFETVFDYGASTGERVMDPEVAAAVRGALRDVVQNGTARRANGVFRTADGQLLPIGGKTGTGDHRFETFGRGGQLLESRVVNRTATFVFFIGDRFYGSISAFVPGPEAARYAFTSALPVQLLADLAPDLMPALSRPAPAGPWPPGGGTASGKASAVHGGAWVGGNSSGGASAGAPPVHPGALGEPEVHPGAPGEPEVHPGEPVAAPISPGKSSPPAGPEPLDTAPDSGTTQVLQDSEAVFEAAPDTAAADTSGAPRR